MKLRTKLSAADCKARLRPATDLSGLALSWDSVGPGVVGEFPGSGFRLHTRKYYNNPFAPFFYGKLKEAGDGIIIVGAFRMNPFIRLTLVFSLSLLMFFSLGLIIVPPQAHPAFGVGRGGLLGACGLLAFLGLGFVQLGKWLSRGEEKTILAFLKSTLEASEE